MEDVVEKQRLLKLGEALERENRRTESKVMAVLAWVVGLLLLGFVLVFPGIVQRDDLTLTMAVGGTGFLVLLPCLIWLCGLAMKTNQSPQRFLEETSHLSTEILTGLCRDLPSGAAKKLVVHQIWTRGAMNEDEEARHYLRGDRPGAEIVRIATGAVRESSRAVRLESNLIIGINLAFALGILFVLAGWVLALATPAGGYDVLSSWISLCTKVAFGIALLLTALRTLIAFKQKKLLAKRPSAELIEAWVLGDFTALDELQRRMHRDPLVEALARRSDWMYRGEP